MDAHFDIVDAWLLEIVAMAVLITFCFLVSKLVKEVKRRVKEVERRVAEMRRERAGGDDASHRTPAQVPAAGEADR